MRRNDRLVIDSEKIKRIIDSSFTLRVVIDNYIVPLSFGYDAKDDKYTFYIHSAKEGTKVDLINNESDCTFELDANIGLDINRVNNSVSVKYGSIIGRGKISLIDDFSERRYAMQRILDYYKVDIGFDDKALSYVNMYKLEVSSFSTKANSKFFEE